MLTAETITDEQLRDLCHRKRITSREFAAATSRRGAARYAHESAEDYNDRLAKGEQVRARCAEILNARAAKETRGGVCPDCGFASSILGQKKLSHSPTCPRAAKDGAL